MTLVKESLLNMREIKALLFEGNDPQGWIANGKTIL